MTSPAGLGGLLLRLILSSPLQSSPKKGLETCSWMENAAVSRHPGFLLSLTLTPLALEAEAQETSAPCFIAGGRQEGEGPVRATPRVWEHHVRTQASDLLVEDSYFQVSSRRGDLGEAGWRELERRQSRNPGLSHSLRHWERRGPPPAPPS